MIITEEKLTGRQNNFDLLRLSAALLVFISHSYDIRGISPQDPLFRLTGWYPLREAGLMIFFSMSGFLVCRSLLNARTVKQFLLNRFLRIWPAYAVCTLLTICCIGIPFTTLKVTEFLIHPQTLLFLAENLSLLIATLRLPGVFNGQPVNVSIWTIPIEVRLYLGLLIVFFISRLRFKQLVLITFLLSWFIKIALPFIHPEDVYSVPFYTFISLGTFFLAGACAYVYREKISFNLFTWLLLFAAYVGMFTWLPRFVILPEQPFVVYSILWMALKWPKIPFIKADFSYAFYLYAFPIQQTLHYFYGNNFNLPVFMLLSFSLTALFSIASWYLIERKALRYKHVILKPAILPGSDLIQQPENSAGGNK